MSDGELQDIADRTSVYARVSPADKLRIVNALQKSGHVIAMTGDGVNDSPALKKADIGVAMGITGTDVAKEASAMVLLDDNFATIVAAVQEGRIIYDNLLRFIKFSLGGNLGKVLVMLCAPLLGITVALRPLQLLWLNLLTDGLMGLGLGFEPAETDVMNRPPRRPNSPILDRTTCVHIGWVGVLIGVLALGVGAAYFDPQDPADTTWQTMIFAALGFAQIGQALGLRAWGHSLLSITANPMMVAVAFGHPRAPGAAHLRAGPGPFLRIDAPLRVGAGVGACPGGPDVRRRPSGEGDTKERNPVGDWLSADRFGSAG